MLLALTAVITLSGLAQPPETLWTRTYGDIADDQARSVQQTFDGGYMIAGFIGNISTHYHDFFLVKTDSIGNTQWTGSYGQGFDARAYAAIQTADCGYLLAGREGISSNMWFYIVKADSVGCMDWEVRISGECDKAMDVVKTSDGMYVVAGWTWTYGIQQPYTNVNCLMVKLNIEGDTLWTSAIGGTGREYATCVATTSDNGFVLAGEYYSSATHSYDFYLVKTDSIGDMQWWRTYGGEEWELAHDVIQTNDGGYVIVGRTDSFGSGGFDFGIVRTDQNGDTIWTRVYGGPWDDEPFSVSETPEGDLIIGGFVTFYGPGRVEYCLMKINPNGDLIWLQTYGGDFDDWGYDAKMTSDGGYILVGASYSFGGGDSDFYVVKTEPEMPSDVSTRRLSVIPCKFIIHNPYPNPFNLSTIITFQVPQTSPVELALYNIEGHLIRVLKNEIMHPGMYSINFNGKDKNGNLLSSGIYFCLMSTPNFQQAQKMVLVK